MGNIGQALLGVHGKLVLQYYGEFDGDISLQRFESKQANMCVKPEKFKGSSSSLDPGDMTACLSEMNLYYPCPQVAKSLSPYEWIKKLREKSLAIYKHQKNLIVEVVLTVQESTWSTSGGKSEDLGREFSPLSSIYLPGICK